MRYISMNLAMPPFDDVHVRKAVNFVVDKAELLRLRGGAVTGEVTGHLLLNSLEDNLLVNYDPFSTPGQRGSLRMARAEMRLSRYDRDGDGRCDGGVCRHLLAAAIDAPGLSSWGPAIRRDLRGIGIEVHLMNVPGPDFFALVGDPRKHVAVALNPGWGKDYPNGSQSVALFDSSSIPEGNNLSLVGAVPGQLARWGYRVRSVPNVDGRIKQCVPLIGADQVRCWASLDQYLTTVVVPWVPVETEFTVQVVSKRVESWSFDQFDAFPALDRFALRPGSR
jgi:ABC-type transport system substrate-binding protein